MRRLLFLVVALIATAHVTQAAQADEMLRRKPGLWKLTVTSVATQLNTPPETKETTAELCTDNAIDVLLYSHDPCQGQLSHKLALSANRELTCNLGVEKMSVHSTTTLTADSAYHSEIRLHADEPAPSDTAITIDGKWTGSCPLGVVPGDLTQDGLTISLRKAMERDR
jgi:hypothetical protein